MSWQSPEAPETEAEVLRRGAALLEDRLPGGWSTRRISGRDKRIDALIEMSDARGNLATLIVEAKRVVEGRDVGRLREQLDVLARQFPRGQGLVVARYLSPPVRAKLTEAGLSYVDATGNMRVEVDSPGLFSVRSGCGPRPLAGAGSPAWDVEG